MSTLLLPGAGAVGDEHNYRETVSPWFRSIFVLRPDVDAVAEAPAAFQLHTLIGMLLFAIWPFTRLVHAFSAPIGYLFRPYIVYRSRDTALGTRPTRPGWERVDRETDERLSCGRHGALSVAQSRDFLDIGRRSLRADRSTPLSRRTVDLLDMDTTHMVRR
jgi:hypothetical protein